MYSPDRPLEFLRCLCGESVGSRMLAAGARRERQHAPVESLVILSRIWPQQRTSTRSGGEAVNCSTLIETSRPVSPCNRSGRRIRTLRPLQKMSYRSTVRNWRIDAASRVQGRYAKASNWSKMNRQDVPYEAQFGYHARDPEELHCLREKVGVTPASSCSLALPFAALVLPAFRDLAAFLFILAGDMELAFDIRLDLESACAGR